MKKLTTTQYNTILGLFKGRCKYQNIKFKSRNYYVEQASFVAGVTAALTVLNIETPAGWQIAASSDREIVENYE